MKQDTQITKVKFLIEKPEGDLPCNVFAFFPEDRYSTTNTGCFTSYAHIGQHSACHIDYANDCKEALPNQYASLKHELENIGYNLQVLNTPAATPIPLNVEGQQLSVKMDYVDDEVYILNEKGRRIAHTGDAYAPSSKIDAEMIVNCVNNYPTLLKDNEALKEQVKVLREALKTMQFVMDCDIADHKNGLRLNDGYAAVRLRDIVMPALSQTETK